MESRLIEIDTEERRILWELSDRVASEESSIRSAIRVITDLDVLFCLGEG